MLNAVKLIKKIVLLTSLFCLFSVSAQAAETYTLDPMHTYVLWHINHLGFSIQAGKFVMIDGTLTLDEAKPQNSKVDVTIHTDDIATGIPKLDEHLKSDKFFNVAKYPTATFTSNKVTVTGKASAKIYGTLTIMGISKPVVLDVTLLKQGLHPMNNKKSVGFSATTTVKRSDFGMKEYLPMLGDDVKLEIGTEGSLAN